MKIMHRMTSVILVLALFSIAGLSISHADEPVHRPGNGEALLAAWSPDGQHIAVVSDANLAIYTAAFEEVAVFEIEDAITSLVWNPDNRQIATTDHARLVQLWEIPSGTVQTLHTASAADDRYTGSVSYNPDGSLLASAHLDNAVRIWDTKTHTLVKTLNLEAPAYVVAWHPDGEWIAVGSSVMTEFRDEGEVIVFSMQIWDTAAEKIIRRFDSDVGISIGDYREIITDPDFVPVRFLQWYGGGKKLLMQTSDFYSERGWNIETDVDDEIPEPMNIIAECGTAYGIARFAPDGNRVAVAEASIGCSGSSGRESWGIEITAQDNLALSRSLNLGSSTIRDITWHPNNQTFATVAGEGGVVIATFDPTIHQDGFEAELILDP